MQAFTDVPVKCCDCKKTFLSASSLLQHFAHHVKIKLVKNNYNKLKLISKLPISLKDNRQHFNDNIFTSNNGKPFNNFLYNSPLTSSDSSLQSVISDKSESISNTESFTENQSLISNNINDNNGIKEDIINENAQQQIPCNNDVKKSLQEAKTTTDGNNIDFNNDNNKNLGKQFCVEFNSEKLLINIEKLSNGNENNKNSSLNLELTTDDCESNSKRKFSNRKQSTPKKIERTCNGLIKLAPRPDNMPPDYGRDRIKINKKNSTSKKKYNCHLCSKVFGWSTDLKRHILVHTGERPFKCTKCSACFTRNFLLQKHKSKIHPNNNKESIEKNKLLELKVNENLKLLKNKMLQLENQNLVKEEHVTDEMDVEENIDNNNYDEEMIFDECKLDIKEELTDPLENTSTNIDPVLKSNDQKNYVNGNWILTNNNNIVNNDKFINSNNVDTSFGPINVGASS